MESLVVEGNVLQVVLAKLAVLIANSLKEFQFINSQIQVWKKKGIKMVKFVTRPDFKASKTSVLCSAHFVKKSVLIIVEM